MKRVSIVFALLVAVGIARVHAAPAPILVYSNDFEGAVGAEWSSILTDTTPIGGRRFLGEFGNDTVTLSLSSLPLHAQISISFDLFIIRSWDGNRVILQGNPVGPDEWDFRVAGGPALLHTTFSQHPPSGLNFPQAYPDTYPGGSNPAHTHRRSRSEHARLWDSDWG